MTTKTTVTFVQKAHLGGQSIKGQYLVKSLDNLTSVKFRRGKDEVALEVNDSLSLQEMEKYRRDNERRVKVRVVSK